MAAAESRRKGGELSAAWWNAKKARTQQARKWRGCGGRFEKKKTKGQKQ